MSSQTMTLRNPINSIISQAITSAVDGVLAKHQHKRRELLRDFIKTTTSVFIQQQKRRTTQIFLRRMTKMVLLATIYLQKQTTARINFMNIMS